MLDVNPMFQGLKPGNHFLASFAIDHEVGTHDKMFSKGQIGSYNHNEEIMIEFEVSEPCEIHIGTLSKKVLQYENGKLN